MGELLLLAASADVEWKAPAPETLEEAVRMNRLAEACYPADDRPALSGRSAPVGTTSRPRRRGAEAARDGRSERRGATPATFICLRGAGGARPMSEAAETLRATADREPSNFAVQFLMGNLCLDGYYEDPGKQTDAIGPLQRLPRPASRFRTSPSPTAGWPICAATYSSKPKPTAPAPSPCVPSGPNTTS